MKSDGSTAAILFKIRYATYILLSKRRAVMLHTWEKDKRGEPRFTQNTFSRQQKGSPGKVWAHTQMFSVAVILT